MPFKPGFSPSSEAEIHPSSRANWDPHDVMGVKKDYHIEKWAFYRENLHRNPIFTVRSNISAFVFAVAIPYAFYKLCAIGMVLSTLILSHSPTRSDHYSTKLLQHENDVFRGRRPKVLVGE